MRRCILFTLVASTALVFLSASPSMELTDSQNQPATNVAAVGFGGGCYNVYIPGSLGGGSGGSDHICSQASLPGGASATLSNGG